MKNNKFLSYFQTFSIGCFFLYLLICTLGLHADDTGFEWNGEAVYEDYKPASSPCEDETSDSFYFRGDLLYWKPHLSGLELDFGTSSIIDTIVDDTQIFLTKESDVYPHFDWNVGYRLAAGYQFGCSDWEIEAFYTYFHGSGSRKCHEDPFTINTGKCKIRFNLFDVVLAYHVSLCPSLLLKPFIGIRNANIHERVDAFLVTDILVSPDTLATETRTFNDRENFNGTGVVFGVQGDWDITCGFGIYGTAATSVLYGDHKLRFKDQDIFTSPFSKLIFSKNTRHLHEFTCNIDLALGIRWQTCILDKYQVTLLLGFEHHQYFNEGHLSVNRGDLCFDGGVFSAQIDF